MMTAQTQESATDVEAVALPSQLQTLSDLVSEKPELFAYGSKDINVAALDATKYIFDLSLQSEATSLPHITEFLESLTAPNATQTRAQTKSQPESTHGLTNSKNSASKFAAFPPTELTTLFVEGMDEAQIWAQLELKAERVSKMLDAALEMQDSETEDDMDNLAEDDDGAADEIDIEELKKLGLDDVEGWEDEDDESEDDEEDEDEESEADDDPEELSDSEHEPLGEGIAPLRDPEDEEEDEESSLPRPSILDTMSTKKKGSKANPNSHGLNDGFFDLRSFNAEIEAAESRSSSRGRLASDEEDDDDEEDDVDLFAPVGMESLNFDEEDLENGGDEDDADLFYQDFFAPPPKAVGKKPASPSRVKSKPGAPSPNGKNGKTTVRFSEEVKVRKIKPKGKNLPLSMMYGGRGLDDEDDDEDDDFGLDGEEGFGELNDEDDEVDEEDEEDESPIGSRTAVKKRKFASLDDEEDEEEEDEEVFTTRETMDRLKDDLFADEDDEEESQKDLSQHEKRMAALQEQIDTLESENVGPKDWVLMGEASSRSRPQNSLLEQDLEFDRVGKFAPTITTESVAALEDRIKARILENQFDDVVRRKKEAERPFLPSRYFELKDTKDKDGLAKIYEDEYMAAQSGGTTDDRDGRLKKEHDELEKTWESICGKLDALCNAHFTPKQPKAIISSISNVSTTSLESALPTTKSPTSLFAPEEIFSAPSQTRTRSELTPQEKKSLRIKQRKQKKRLRESMEKARGTKGVISGKSAGSVKKEKKKALESVVKTGKGVTVVGKKREEVLGRDKKGKKGKS